MTEQDSSVESAAPGASRIWYGWILVGLLSTFLFGSQTLAYLTQEKAEKSFMQQESALKMAEVQASGMGMVYQAVSLPEKEKAKAEENLVSLRTTTAKSVLEQLSKEIATNDSAAVIALAASIKLNQEPPQAAVDRLKGSKNAELKLLVIDGEKATADQAKQLWSLLKTGSYSQRVAAAEVLSRHPDGKGAKEAVLSDSEVKNSLFSLSTFILLVALGTLTLALGAVLHFTGYWKSKRMVVDLATADKYAVYAGLFFCLFLVLPLFIILSIRSLPIDPAAKSFIAFGSLTVGFILLLKLPIEGTSYTFSRIFGSLEKPLRQIVIGFAAYAANFPLIVIMGIAISIITAPLRDVLPQPTHPLNEVMAGGSVWPLIFAGLTAVVLAPILEEIVFRGLLFPALARVITPLAACLIQGFVFAAIHPQGLTAIPVLMIIGVMGSVVAWKEGSLLPAMVMHAAHNFTILIVGRNLM